MKRKARKLFFSLKTEERRLLGWKVFRNAKTTGFSLACECKRPYIVNHRFCNETRFSYLNLQDKPRLPKKLQQDICSFHQNNSSFLKPLVLSELEIGNKLTRMEWSGKIAKARECLKDLPETMPEDIEKMAEECLDWIDVPKVEGPLRHKDLVWTTKLHPNLAYSSLPVTVSKCKLAPKGYINKVRTLFGKHCVDYDFLRKQICDFCIKRGHKTGQCDALPTLRPLRTPKQDAFVRFLRRLPRVEWKTSALSPVGVALSLPEVWRQILARVREFHGRWGRYAESVGFEGGSPWEPCDYASMPLISRRGLPFFWAIGTSGSVLTKIAAGDFTRWVRKPERFEFPNDPSCIEHSDFLEEKVEDLLECGAITPVPEGWARRILGVKVVHSSNKLRIIIRGDANRHLIPNVPFKLPSMDREFRYFVEPGTALLTWDLKSAFYQGGHVHPDTAAFHCFKWFFPGTKRVVTFAINYRFLGDRLSPVRFVRNHSPIPRFLNKIGIPTFNYVDDSNVCTPDDPFFAKSQGTFCKNLLSACCQVINKKKTRIEELRTKSKVLGLFIDFESMRFSLTQMNHISMLLLINRALSRRHTTLRNLAKIKGKLTAFKAAIYFAPQLTTAFNAHASKLLQKYPMDTAWDIKTRTPAPVKAELLFILENLHLLQNRPIFRESWGCDIWTDASETQVGSHCKHGWAISPLPQHLIGKSSTAREAYGIWRALEERVGNLRGRAVRVFCDNLGIVTALGRNGSKNALIDSILKNLIRFLVRNNIDAFFRWQRRSVDGLALADAL